jgi:cell wall-associated NlpC family hydrolase
MRVWIFYIFSAFLLVSCGAKKSIHTNNNSYKSENLRKLTSRFDGKISNENKNLLKSAEQYLGIPYRYGGATTSGFDCSGLVCKVFDENNKKLPRQSNQQAQIGKKIEIEDSQPGDLIFFATSGGDKVSHVGIVHDIGVLGEVKFIHSSTSKGVMVSSLNDKYWNKAYLFIRRLNLN